MTDQIRDTGFSCLSCGSCCRETEPGSNLVMVGPEEIRRMMDASGLAFEEIVTPYPSKIHDSGREYTFGWVIRRKEDHCMFLRDNTCLIYASRPWICRTYPFMLTEEGLKVHPCLGIGSLKETERPLDLAFTLCMRLDYEQEEEDRIREILQSAIVPEDRPVVIDGEGIKEYYG
ncbi:MAG: YkgJ family cysteine cluster protein [Methanospirillum sp.]|nr:YkgJ family cysteine cluster protein [Methanospirillum sp.]